MSEVSSAATPAPSGDALPPEASRRERVLPRTPLPWTLKILIGFLAADASLRLGLLAHRAVQRDLAAITREDLWNLLIGTFYLLLIPQILVRSIAARISLSIVFLAQIGLFVARYAILEPELWWGATATFRLQQLAQVLFFAVFVLLLNCKPISRSLRH